MSTSYLLRLSSRSKPHVRDEIARILGNLAAVESAKGIVADLRSRQIVGSVGNGLHHLADDLKILRWNCDNLALAARRAVCRLVSERRRQRIMLSAMLKVAGSTRGPGGQWDDRALAEAAVVSEASLVDPALFEKVIVRLQAVKIVRRSTSVKLNATLARYPHFRGSVPDFPDPLSDWCSFIIDLQPQEADLASMENRHSDRAEAA